MPEPVKKCIVVLGMHRSGTSMISGILQLAGWSLGKDLLPPLEDNPKGFFENSRITFFNEKLLDELYAKWNDTLLIPDLWWAVEEMLSYKKALEDILESEFDDSSFFLLKDPRISVLVPFYLEVFQKLDIEPYFIICLRNPLEIARSLDQRNNLTTEKSLLLWMDYTLKSEYYTRKQKRIMIRYKDVLDSPAGFLKVLSDKFHLLFDAGDDLLAKIAKFVEPGLMHHDISDDLVGYDSFPEINRFYSIMLGTKNGDVPLKDMKEIDLLRGKFYNDFRLYNGIGETLEAVLTGYSDSGKLPLTRKEIKFGKNTLEFDLRGYSNITQLHFKPAKTRVGIHIYQIRIKDKNRGSYPINKYNSNAEWILEDDTLIFETEMPLILINLEPPNQVTKIIIELSYFVFARATYRMSAEEKNKSIRQLTKEIKIQNKIIRDNKNLISLQEFQIDNLLNSYTWKTGKIIMSPFHWLYRQFRKPVKSGP
jgi:hypothetical protein